MRAQWRNEAAFAVAQPPAPAFGRRRKRWRDIDLVVDLGEEPLSRRWWRGRCDASACCAASVALIAPNPFEPLPAAPADQVGSAEAAQYRELAICAAWLGFADRRTDGGQCAGRAADRGARPAVRSNCSPGSAAATASPHLLGRSGVSYAEAGEAARLIAARRSGRGRPRHQLLDQARPHELPAESGRSSGSRFAPGWTSTSR